MNYDDISPELRQLLDETPVLSEKDLNELAEANEALDFDPEFVADCIKGDFVNDILHEMAEQGLNNNQLAKKWGKSRQHVGRILDKEKAKNFTIDSMVSLSMVLGLRPQRIVLESMEMVAKVQVTATRDKIKLEAMLDVDWCKDDECACVSSFDFKNTDQPDPVAADESYGLAA